MRIGQMGTYAQRTLAEVVAAVKTVDRRPVLIGIDGHSGAGKSTLARELCGQLPEPGFVVEGDDFYRLMPAAQREALSAAEGYERYFDWERLRDQVLRPVREGRSRLRYQRYDWDTEQMGDWVDVPVPAMVIVEGVYTLRPQLRPFLDVAVLVGTDHAARFQRQIDRDQDTMDWINRWAAAEHHYANHHPPAQWADLVVRGE